MTNEYTQQQERYAPSYAPQNVQLAGTRFHSVTIQKVVNGFIVTVGCKVFVFESFDSMLMAVKEYFENPEKAEKKYVDDIQYTRT